MTSNLPLLGYTRQLVVTQNAAGGGTNELRLTIPAGGYLDIDMCVLGPDTLALARTVTVTRQRPAGTVVESIASIVEANAQRTSIAPLTAAATTAAGDLAKLVGRWRLYGGDVLSLSQAGAAQNETLTVTVRGMVRRIPVATAPQANTTLTEADT